MKVYRLIRLAFPFLLVASVNADRGGFPLGKKIDIEEAAQNAIIAWDGKVQKTILTTHLSAKEEVEIVEIMPFPSRPTIEKADFEIFRKLKEIIDREYEKQKADTGHGSRSKGYREGGVPPKNIQFVERKIIGQNDITVFHIDSLAGIRGSLNRYLESIGVKEARVDKGLIKVIKAYVREGTAWFVLNRIRIGPNPVSNEAISYTFKTRRGFYPLKISNTKAGQTSINLMILTPNFVIEKSRHGWQPIARMFAPRLDYATLLGLDKDAFSMMAGAEAIFFTIWNISGDIKRFDRDVLFTARPLYRRDGKMVGTKPFFDWRTFDWEDKWKDK